MAGRGGRLRSPVRAVGITAFSCRDRHDRRRGSRTHEPQCAHSRESRSWQMSSTSTIRMSMGPAGMSNLLERVAEGLPQGLLPVEVFNDEDVFQAEMQQIFATAWVFVAHESEIRNKGDY